MGFFNPHATGETDVRTNYGTAGEGMSAGLERPMTVARDWRVGRSTDFSSLNILIIDEDPLQRMLMHTALVHLGVGRVTDAHDGLSGLGMLEHSDQVFDIVISDLQMEQMDGAEFMRLAPMHKMASLILLCGLGQDLLASAATRCRACGVTLRGVLPKPVRLPQLKILLAS